MKHLLIIFSVFLFSFISISCTSSSSSSSTTSTDDTYYLNNSGLIEDRNNSVYDIDFYKDNLYIAEYRKNRITIISTSFNLIKRINTPVSPHGIEVDNNGNIYVASYSDNRILKIDHKHNLQTDWDDNIRDNFKLINPVSIDTDSLNNIYISGYNYIIKVKEDGNLLKIFETNDSILPHGITFYNNKLYIADRDSKDILIYNLDGNLLNKIELEKVEPISVNIVRDLLYIVNGITDSIHIHKIVNNEFTEIIGKRGTSYKEWLGISNLIYDNDKYIYTTEQDTNRIQKIKSPP